MMIDFDIETLLDKDAVKEKYYEFSDDSVGAHWVFVWVKYQLSKLVKEQEENKFNEQETCNKLFDFLKAKDVNN